MLVGFGEGSHGFLCDTTRALDRGGVGGNAGQRSGAGGAEPPSSGGAESHPAGGGKRARVEAWLLGVADSTRRLVLDTGTKHIEVSPSKTLCRPLNVVHSWYDHRCV